MPIPAQIQSVYKTRKLPAKYDGNICTFDLDKTYLATNFEKISGLVKIPFEKAEEKKNIPGASAIVKEIRKGLHKDSIPTPIYFISGSPKQLENVIREKLEMDGVIFDGILFKDFISAIRKFQFKKLIDKIGFKLGALLYARNIFPPKAQEFLFGDDSEYDALIYSLYADIVCGNLEDFEVLTILHKWDIAKDEFNLIKEALQLLRSSPFKPKENSVQKIFIHLETGTSPMMYSDFSSKIIPTRNYFQTAIVLYQMDVITRAALFRIISEFIHIENFTVNDFTVSTEDLITRNLMEKKEARKLLKIISKGNPLALPIRLLTDLKLELNKMAETFSRMPDAVIKNPMRKNNSDLQLSLVEKYLRIEPKRNV